MGSSPGDPGGELAEEGRRDRDLRRRGPQEPDPVHPRARGVCTVRGQRRVRVSPDPDHRTRGAGMSGVAPARQPPGRPPGHRGGRPPVHHRRSRLSPCTIRRPDQPVATPREISSRSADTTPTPRTQTTPITISTIEDEALTPYATQVDADDVFEASTQAAAGMLATWRVAKICGAPGQRGSSRSRRTVGLKLAGINTVAGIQHGRRAFNLCVPIT